MGSRGCSGAGVLRGICGGGRCVLLLIMGERGDDSFVESILTDSCFGIGVPQDQRCNGTEDGGGAEE